MGLDLEPFLKPIGRANSGTQGHPHLAPKTLLAFAAKFVPFFYYA